MLDGRRNLIYGELAYIYYLIFIIVMTRLLISMLTGLSVGNINNIRNNARLEKISEKVKLIERIHKATPKYFRKRMRPIVQGTIYPNKRLSLYEVCV